MASVSLRDLLEAGVHFGHQTRRWNPKMKPYIYGQKNGIHIIDLQKTAKSLVDATKFVTSTVTRGQSVLFVGTKRAAQDLIKEEAVRSGMYYVNNRWLGGTLTNFQTVKKSIERLNSLERAKEEGKFDLLSKKEALELSRKISKMDKALGGIKHMKGLPGAIFVIDPKKEYIAIREAGTLGIPVVAVCDTNCNPSGISYVIPGNDDAIKSIALFTKAIAEAAIEGGVAGRDDVLGDQMVAGGEIGDVEIYRRGGEERPVPVDPSTIDDAATEPEVAADDDEDSLDPSADA